MVDQSTGRPHTTSMVSSRTASRRSLATSYLDLKPLPEDVMLESPNNSFENNDKSIVSSSWDEEGESIKRDVLGRLPSSKSLDGEETKGPQRDPMMRPQTAPVGHDSKPFNREGLLLSSNSARSARYLAIQWRSRATQLSLSTKSLGDARSVESPPAASRISDEGSVSSESSRSDDDSESTGSNYSAETMDESIKSQVSDAQKVVEKWQQRWHERSESMSFCSETASRDEEEERRTSSSTETQKTGNISKSKSREEILPDAMLQFAMKPTPSERALLTNEHDSITVESALKPLPLQPVESGNEFFSNSQKNIGVTIEEVDEESVEEGNMSGSQNSVFVMNESGTVVETIDEYATAEEFTVDEETVNEDIKTIDDSTFADENTKTQDDITFADENTKAQDDITFADENTNAQDDSTFADENTKTQDESTFADDNTKAQDDNTFADENLSHASSSKALDVDDQLSEHSTAEQSAHLVEKSLNDTNLSFETQTTQLSVVQTFCEPPEALVPRPVQAPQEEESVASSQTPVNDENSASIDETPKTTHSSKKQIQKPSKRAEVPPKSPKISALKKKNKEYTGSVQERINAVKRSREAARKKSSKRPPSPKTKTGSRPQSAEKTTKRAQSPKTPSIKWTEHKVVFTFGLLTSYKAAPPKGAYSRQDEESSSYKNKLKTKSRLLYEIMKNFGEIIRRTKSLGNGSTKYMMCSPDSIPRPVLVQHDAKFKAPANRPRIKRCVVKAVVPIFVPKGNDQAKEVATHVVLDLFAVAISKGEFDGLIFEKVA